MVEIPDVKVDEVFTHKIFEDGDDQPMFKQFLDDTQKE